MIRVGIAGIGFMGMTHFNAYQKVRGAKVVAFCEQDKKRLAGDWTTIKGNFGPQGTMMDMGKFACYENLEDMFADPNVDMVDICLPPSAHAKTAVAALKAGKNVVCEKPIALTPADANKMVEAAKKAKKILSIAHVLPFFPEYNFAYQAMKSGKYGQLLGGQFKRIISDPVWMTHFFDPNICGGPMLDLHIHDAQFIRLMFGMPKTVRTVGTMRGEVVERFNTQFIYDPPKMVTATSGVINQQGRPFTHAYEIYFEKATLLFDFAALAEVGNAFTPLTVLLANGKVLRPKLGSGDPCDAFPIELAEAVKAVKTGQSSPLLDGQLARDAVVMCQKQTESVVKGREVRI